jgi:hypothetical protein
MVNVRATIDRAFQVGVVEPALAAALVQIAKSLFYKDRTYEAIRRPLPRMGLRQRRFAVSRDGSRAGKSIRSASMREMLQASWRILQAA